jgi:hypothetical protein
MVLSSEATTDRHYTLRAHSRSWLDRQRFARVGIDHRQDAEALAIDQLIGHKIHQPSLSRLGRQIAFPARNDQTPASRQLGTQPQRFFAAQAIYPVLAHGPTLTPQQHLDAALAVADPHLGQFTHAGTQSQLRVFAGPVGLNTSMLLYQTAGPPLTRAVVAHNVIHRLPLQRGPGHFFD